MVWIVLGAAVLLFAAAALVRWIQTSREAAFPLARERFRYQREHLEARFFHLAAASGKPRGLIWKDCQWDDHVEFARDRTSGQILAFVGISLQFEAVPGSDMEGLPAVGNLRNASAVFAYHRGQWHTQGRAVFNLNPDEAIQHFQHQYERLQHGCR
jgi:hypothetical protein